MISLEITLPNTVRVACFAMRTRFEILLCDSHRNVADLRAAGEAALAEITEAETLLSAYRSDAALFRLNVQAASYTGPFPVEPRLFSFLSEAMALAEHTKGAFDPTIGDKAAVTLNHKERSVLYTFPGVGFDPGGIGKGWALERARDILREAGITNALLHGGTSSVAVMGEGPTGDGWQIALANPLKEGHSVATWRLQDGDALGVSANYDRTDHIFDPRTGEPVVHTLLAAIMAPSATTADALSTALLVLGTDGFPLLRSQFPEVTRFLAVQPDGTVVSTG